MNREWAILRDISNMSSRESKPSSKYDDCVTGSDLENALELENTHGESESNFETPVPHKQIDGKTNNVSFTTSPDRLEQWKSALINFFGKDSTTTMKNGTVVKIISDFDNSKNTIKVNFYKSGSVVIQGAKCMQFSDTFFQQIKDYVDHKNGCENDCTKDNHDDTVVEDTSITFAKKLAVNEDMRKTSTPRSTATVIRNILSPKDKVTQHNLTISAKIESVNNSLLTIETSMESFIQKVSDIKTFTETLIPSLKNTIPEAVASHKKFTQVQEHVDKIDNKLKHCNQSVESIHTKLNIVDGQLKQLLNSISDEKVKRERVERLCEENHDNISSISSKLDEIQARLVKYELANNDLNTKNHASTREESTAPQEVIKNTECDYLILSDSVLKRIIPSKFTPRGKTVTRFIRGGVQECTKFIKDDGCKIKPKNILLNIGTRDLAKPQGINNTIVMELCETIASTWTEAKIFVLPIIRRMDIQYDTIKRANYVIETACSKLKFTMLEEFKPTDNMFYDKVHLNNIGLPAVVKHLKNTMKIYGNPGNYVRGIDQVQNSYKGKTGHAVSHFPSQNWRGKPGHAVSHFPPRNWNPVMNSQHPQWIPPNHTLHPPWVAPTRPPWIPPWTGPNNQFYHHSPPTWPM